ncbi:MAG: hypothetical protein MJK12_16090 [Colwellia sp.]|nr:hypothetical protein [Colwellia sp.]
MKKITTYLFLLITTFLFACGGGSNTEPLVVITDPFFELDILAELESLPNVRVSEIETIGHFSRVFELFITQPVDHDNPTGETFEQQVFLSHIDASRPMIFETDGYAVRRNSVTELSEMLKANQLYVEHRYFGDSAPESMDWQYLRVKQAAEDNHKIVTLLKSIYQDKWIGSGTSKGGETAFIHRRFFPDDVDATVAYVAPLQFAAEDPRLYSFFDTDVDQVCQSKVKEMQRHMLSNRAELSGLLDTYLPQYDLTYQRLGEEAVIEYAILEYMFIFWQYGSSCDDIPALSVSMAELFNYLHQVSPIWFYSDQELEGDSPSMYQFMVETGYYGYILDHLVDLLVYVDTPSLRIFAPQDTDLTYIPETNIDINQWLQNEGNEIIYIYQAFDPWTAAAVELIGNTDALKIVTQQGAGHSVRIADLTVEEFTVVNNKLIEWTGYTLDKSNLTSKALQANYLKLTIPHHIKTKPVKK